jgi:predicted phage replisome organizer
MSLNKKYFYLKLKDSFFDREEIRVIQGLENGDTYVCIILEMYLRSLKRNGILMMSERIPYSIRTLSSVLKRRQDEIKYAVDLFKEFGLIEILNSGAIFMADIQDFIGESSTEADRIRAYRTKISEE